MRHFLVVVRGIFLKGAGPAELWLPIRWWESWGSRCWPWPPAASGPCTADPDGLSPCGMHCILQSARRYPAQVTICNPRLTDAR